MSFDRSPLVVGHRGAAGLAPENTLQSFALAARLGVAAVELDVHYVHGKLIVIHDDSLDRTTSGSGALSGQDLETLRCLDAGLGQSIPYLEEVFAAVPNNIGINIELKGRDTARPVVEWLIGQQDRDVLISSFNLDELREFKNFSDGRFKVAPLFDKWRPAVWPVAEALGAWSINLSVRAASKRRIDEAIERGLKVLVYTVNDGATARRLLGWGVAGFFTDFPNRMIALAEG